MAGDMNPRVQGLFKRIEVTGTIAKPKKDGTMDRNTIEKECAYYLNVVLDQSDLDQETLTTIRVKDYLPNISRGRAYIGEVYFYFKEDPGSRERDNEVLPLLEKAKTEFTQTSAKTKESGYVFSIIPLGGSRESIEFDSRFSEFTYSMKEKTLAAEKIDFTCRYRRVNIID